MLFSTRASKLSKSSEGDATKHTHTHTHTHRSIRPYVFHSFLHSKLSFLFTVIDVVIVIVVVFFFCLFVLTFRIKKKEKRTLDGLLKLCNVKAKQMCFYYLCL